MSDDESGSDELSDGEDFEGLGALDLIQLNDEERREVENLLDDNHNNDSGDDDDDTPVRYAAPENFEWTDTYTVNCREPFSERPGPVRLFDTSASVLDFFQVFYTDEVFTHIVECTNINANSKRRDDPDNNKGLWHDTTLDEIKAFYGVLIMMDIIKLDREDLYWKESDSHFLLGTNIPDVITRDRCMQIKRYLHFCREDENPRNDKLYKVRYMLTNIREKFLSEYVPHEEISIDESMVPFKGRLSFKQYMKDKPCKFGIKCYERLLLEF